MLAYDHVHLLLLDETQRRLYMVASRGYDAESVGAEVAVGAGVVGMAAELGAAVRVGNLGQMAKYAETIRREWIEEGGDDRGSVVPMPGLPGAQSRMAVPAVALGQVLGVLVAESTTPVAFGREDEAALVVVASLFAGTYEALGAEERAADATVARPDSGWPVPATAPSGRTNVRFYAVDGSTFVDDEYLIKGVAGRILWSLLGQHAATGRVEFTNRELRLDPSLQMPGFKDNLESRLVLLARRLDEREAPVRLAKTGRGRFRMDLATTVTLEAAGPATPD